MISKQRLVRAGLALALIMSVQADVRADSVAQIATSVRISRATATLIDPQGRPGMTTTGSRTAVRPGDILTFIAHFTPVPNGRIRGLGGYVTFYVPRNTEVVGARIIDSTGATVAPHRGGLSADGCGPRGCTGYGMDTSGTALEEGSMSQLYADTGIFYATDPRTARVPDGSVAAETFLSLSNGILMVPESTAFGQLDGIVGAIDLYAHNQWDAIQVYAFGVDSGAINANGDGNTPHRYGSAV
ncbi:MAG: hypothetical protein GWN07_41600, partial [Actinobacteria bacterium]|nr:hypothetical protein [Actinomycetota bacterium]NIS37535.1 hypothetical protein [Actinomycetota bacterium]NIU71944.1 hypothetical protein [Actinomycetota bacterium]NIW33879.1 hypothetical protein [Actinomycetota bacterium]NIX25969.1 hypothetical protein [Actinomycetota bacterium]